MRLNSGLLILTCSTLLAGCGGGEDAISGARNNPNDFAGNTNPLNDFSSGSTGDSSNSSGLAGNEVRITLEVPGGVAPNSERTRRNLRIVQPDRLQVYTTNTSLQNLGSVPVTQRTDDNGAMIIAFDEGLPLGPDTVIEASYGNTRIRAFAADADRDVKINPFSEYLVRNTLADYSETELQVILDCVEDAQGQLCLNKYVWSTLADQVHDFEIDIPDSADLNRALSELGDRGDFVSYVSAMARYALLDERSSGKISASSADYNAVFLGVELGQTFLEGSLAGSGQWGVRLAQEERLEDTNGVGYVYPALTLTSFDAFNIKVTSLASDIPYERQALIHQNGNNFFPRGSELWPLNTHATSPGAATLLDDTRLLAGRALYQSITGRGSSKTMGWTRNPYYLDAYTSTPSSENEGGDRVVSGYFSAGKLIELEESGDELPRKATLEDHYLSVLEIDLLRQEGFDLDTLDGANMNVVALALNFGDAAVPVAFETGMGTWSIDVNGAASDGRATATVTQSLTTEQIQRASNGSVSSNVGTRLTPWTLSPRVSRLSKGDIHIGRLNLDEGQASGSFERPDLGVGASTPAGDLLAFNLNGSPAGDGLLIAGIQTATPAPVDGSYRLQGVRLGLAPDSNTLSHYDNATLTINSSTTASLSPRTLDVVHSVSGESVSAPTTQASADIALSYADLTNGQVSFVAGNLRLEGFVTPDQEQLYLRLRNAQGGEEQIGLLVATRIP